MLQALASPFETAAQSSPHCAVLPASSPPLRRRQNEDNTFRSCAQRFRYILPKPVLPHPECFLINWPDFLERRAVMVRFPQRGHRIGVVTIVMIKIGYDEFAATICPARAFPVFIHPHLHHGRGGKVAATQGFVPDNSRPPPVAQPGYDAVHKIALQRLKA